MESILFPGDPYLGADMRLSPKLPLKGLAVQSYLEMRGPQTVKLKGASLKPIFHGKLPASCSQGNNPSALSCLFPNPNKDPLSGQGSRKGSSPALWSPLTNPDLSRFLYVRDSGLRGKLLLTGCVTSLGIVFLIGQIQA
jgi:hypothetical protein